jgi:hypothetical protein
VQDWAASARLFQRTAAAHSHGPSAYYLGLQLANGQGVPTDYRLAEAALQAAAGSGDSRVADRAGAALADLRRANVLAEVLHAAELREMRAALAASDAAAEDGDSACAGDGNAAQGNSDSGLAGGGDSAWAGSGWAGGGDSAVQDSARERPHTHAARLDRAPVDAPALDGSSVTVGVSNWGAPVAMAADGTALDIDVAAGSDAAGSVSGQSAEGTQNRISAADEG